MDKAVFQGGIEHGDFDAYERCRREAEEEIRRKIAAGEMVFDEPEESYVDPIQAGLVETTHWAPGNDMKYDRFGNPIRPQNRKMYTGLETQNDHITPDFEVTQGPEDRRPGRKIGQSGPDNFQLAGPENVTPDQWKTMYQAQLDGETAALDDRRQRGKQKCVPDFEPILTNGMSATVTRPNLPPTQPIRPSSNPYAYRATGGQSLLSSIGSQVAKNMSISSSMYTTSNVPLPPSQRAISGYQGYKPSAENTRPASRNYTTVQQEPQPYFDNIVENYNPYPGYTGKRK